MPQMQNKPTNLILKTKQKKRTYHKQTKRSECLKQLQTWQKCLNMKLSCSDDDLLSSSESQLSTSCSPAICPGILNSPFKESLMTRRRLHRSRVARGDVPDNWDHLGTFCRTLPDVLNVPPCVPLIISLLILRDSPTAEDP
jgi:hypothetical protein